MLCNEVVKIFDDIYFRDKIIVYTIMGRKDKRYQQQCLYAVDKRELGQKFNDRGNETVKVKEMNFFFSTIHKNFVLLFFGEVRKLG